MAQQQLKKLKYDGKEVVVEVANRDGNGSLITSTYLKGTNLAEGDGIDISSSTNASSEPVRTISIEKTSSSNLGGMITGTGLTAASNGTVSLNQATTSAIGGIILGTGLTYNSTSGKVDVSSAAWSGVTSKPFSTLKSADFTVSETEEKELQLNTTNWGDKTWVSDNFLSINTTIPATNVIPAVNTANKILLSTTTSGTAAWSAATKGSTTKPIYLNSSGVLSEGSTYAGGTKVTLNGTDKGASTASIYAPTSAGTSGQLLVSSGGDPAWSSWSTAGLLKTNSSGVVSIDTTAYITKDVNNLTNYYTKTEIDSSLSGIHQFSYETASELPTASASTMYKIYIVPATNSATNNIKDEFITIDKGSGADPRYVWEQIGSTVLDLGGYVTAASTLTSNKIVIGNGNKDVKVSSYEFDSSTTTVSNTANKVPLSQAVYAELGKKQNTLTFSTGLTNTSNTVTLNTATANALGGIKIGTGLSIANDGTVSVSSATSAGSADSATNATNAENWTNNPFTVTDVTLNW